MLLLYRFSSSVTVVQFSTHSIGPSDISILKVDRLLCDTCRHSFAYIWRSPFMSIFMLYTRFTFLLFTAHQLHESRIKNKPFYRYYNHTRASDNRSILLTRYLNPNAFFAFTQNLWWTVSTPIHIHTHILLCLRPKTFYDTIPISNRQYWYKNIRWVDSSLRM